MLNRLTIVAQMREPGLFPAMAFAAIFAVTSKKTGTTTL